MAEVGLIVIVPSRGRPQSVERLVTAWTNTHAYDDASLIFVIDRTDPHVDAYLDQADAELAPMLVHPGRPPMVEKLNAAAIGFARQSDIHLAFAGDDHIPRTPGWAKRYCDELDHLGTGIVYGDDLLQGDKLPTQWAMTADIVRTLGRMVPADVEHLYCDNSILDLGQAADCIRYLPDVIIEHMHPAAGKAVFDDGYQAVNNDTQIAHDRAAYEHWRAVQLPAQADAVRALRGEGRYISKVRSLRRFSNRVERELRKHGQDMEAGPDRP